MTIFINAFLALAGLISRRGARWRRGTITGGAGHELIFFCPQNSLFAHNRFSTLFIPMEMPESEKIVLVSCIIDFDDIQV